MPVSGGVAKRYANAAFQAALRRDAVDEVGGDLVFIHRALKAVPNARAFLAQPLVPLLRKDEYLRRSFGERVGDLSLAFLSLVVQRRRIDVLDQIIEVYTELTNDWRKVATAEVVTAVSLTAVEKEMITERLVQMTGKSITLNDRVDTDIIGGLVVHIGDQLMDMSLGNQLERIRERLKQVRITSSV